MFSPGKVFGRQSDDFGLRLVDPDEIQILLDQCARSARLVDERNELRSARQSLDPDRTGPGAKIKQSSVVTDPWSEYVEECFAKSVRRWTSSVISGTF